MSTPAKWTLISEAEYLRQELLREQKHEFVSGRVHATPDSTNRHNEISGNVLAALRSRLRGTPCKPCNSNTKVRIRLLSSL
jgi:hypothetical protein